jgi:hypothetical protein
MSGQRTDPPGFGGNASGRTTRQITPAYEQSRGPWGALWGRSAPDGEELPGSGETFQFVFSTVVEFDARTGNAGNCGIRWPNGYLLGPRRCCSFVTAGSGLGRP